MRWRGAGRPRPDPVPTTKAVAAWRTRHDKARHDETGGIRHAVGRSVYGCSPYRDGEVMDKSSRNPRKVTLTAAARRGCRPSRTFRPSLGVERFEERTLLSIALLSVNAAGTA